MNSFLLHSLSLALRPFQFPEEDSADPLECTRATLVFICSVSAVLPFLTHRHHEDEINQFVDAST